MYLVQWLKHMYIIDNYNINKTSGFTIFKIIKLLKFEYTEWKGYNLNLTNYFKLMNK